MEELKGYGGEKVETPANQEKGITPKEGDDGIPTFLQRGITKEANLSVPLKPSRPPPKIVATAKVQLPGVVEFEEFAQGDDEIGFATTTGPGFSQFGGGMNDDFDAPPRYEEKPVYGGRALDLLAEKKATLPRATSSVAPTLAKSPSASSPVAMPQQNAPLARSSTVQYAEAQSAYYSAPKVQAPAPPPQYTPPPVSAPSIDIPAPPSIDIPAPPSIDIPAPPSIDIPAPPSFDIPAPPSFDIPAPPAMNVPAPPPISAPAKPKTTPAPPVTGERGIN